MALAPLNKVLGTVFGTAQSFAEKIGLDSLKRIIGNSYIGEYNVGLLFKSDTIMKETLSRNMGNGLYLSSTYQKESSSESFNGFTDVIGETANPYYNTYAGAADYLKDTQKNNYSDYIAYINGVYGGNGASWTRWFGTAATLATTASNILGVFGTDISKEANIIANGAQAAGMIANNLTALFKKKKKDEVTSSNLKNTCNEELEKYFLRKSYSNISPVGVNDWISIGNDKITNPNQSAKKDTPLGENAAAMLASLFVVNRYSSEETDMGEKYLQNMTIGDGGYELPCREDTAEKLNLELKNLGHNNIFNAETLFSYAESEKIKGQSAYDENDGYVFNAGTRWGGVMRYEGLCKDDIIKYTNARFNNLQYGTLIGRFHSNVKDWSENDPIQTSYTQYGISRGMNLLKKDHADSKTNGYEDPYCRVWTFHKQYAKYKDAIRPFSSGSQEELRDELEYMTPSGANDIWSKSLLNKWKNSKTHLVRLAPNTSDRETIEQCMFSIENLAWKNNGLKEGNEMEGPNGGRIMWFPPYDLKFSENINANWNSTQFIGRGEPIYTYTNTDRGGTLDFTLLIDHPMILDKWTATNQPCDGADGSALDPATKNTLSYKDETLLRFFAGCEVLHPLHKKKDEGNNDIKNNPNENPDPEAKIKSGDKLCFFVYYPNNYSGVDDSNKNNTIEYLLHGIGAQKSENGELGISSDEESVGYEMRNKGISYFITGKTSPASAVVESYEEYYGTLLPISASQINPQNRKANGKTNHWWYRCDKAYLGQLFPDETNYWDDRSYRLNSTGYLQVTDYSIGQEFKEENGDCLYSLADFVAAFDANNGAIVNDVSNEDRVLKLRTLIRDRKVKSLYVCGYADQNGYVNSNVDLSVNRAKTILSYVKTLPQFRDTPVNKGDEEGRYKIEAKGDTQSVGSLTKEASNKKSKVWRCAKVTIELESEDVKNANETSQDDANELNLNLAGQTFKWGNIDITIPEAEQASPKELKVGDIIIPAVEQNQIDNDQQRQENTDKALNDDTVTAATATSRASEGRHSANEYEYFQDLEINDPLVFKSITDKIKYFDPAFHSITPEGFNARLTFLQQCTRQGNTLDVYKGQFGSAENMAFGAPPVCVLKIGDFYNTRIIIESLSINYVENQWDLNDEGIGVMPMMAKISISFKFIGGSDLAGPIRRLQNALSFNYYANTRVYDDRAESITKLESENFQQ